MSVRCQRYGIAAYYLRAYLQGEAFKGLEFRQSGGPGRYTLALSNTTNGRKKVFSGGGLLGRDSLGLFDTIKG